MSSIAKISAMAILLVTTTIGGYAINEASAPKNIKEQLENWDGLKALDTTQLTSTPDTNSKDYKSWKAILGNSNIKSELEKFAPEAFKQSSEKDKINELKKKCKSALEAINGTDEFRNQLKDARSFCSIKIPEQKDKN